MKLIRFIHRAYQKFGVLAALLQSPLILLIRGYWGWKFYETGWGKLQHLTETAKFFGEDLQLPFPMVNAALAGATECFGGLFLLAGLASRAAALGLTTTMVVAYLTAHREAAHGVWQDPEKFIAQEPFLFLYAALLVLAYGPGVFSVDWVLGKIYRKKLSPPEQTPT